MEGTLIKYTNFFGGWKERIFILKGPILYYYYNKNELPKCKIHMGISNIINDEENDFFEIDTGSAVISLKAETKEMRDKWVKALQVAKLEGTKSIRQAIKDSKNQINTNEYITPEAIDTGNVNLEQINVAATKLDMDNQSFDNLIEKGSFNITQYKILLERYKEDVAMLMKNLGLDLNQNYDNSNNIGNNNINNEIINTNSKNEKNDENNKLKSFNPQRKKEYNLPLNNHYNQNKTVMNYEQIPYSADRMIDNKDNISNSIIFSNEKFFDLEEVGENIPSNNIYNISVVKPKMSKKLSKYEMKYDENKSAKKTDNIYDEDNKLIISRNSNIIEYGLDNDIKNNTDKRDQWKFYDPLYDFKRRSQLPVERKKVGLNVWQVFKSAVGKDLSHFSVPVLFNEPLSSLQKFCEPFQYADLLNKASKCDDQYMRLGYTAAFCIGEFAQNNGRQTKYFNPLLYETFEYVDNKLGYRYFAEQVSHHPAISAYYCEGNQWNMYANTNAVMEFFITGRLEVEAIGRSYVNYLNYSDHVAFTKPKIIIRNLIFGTIDLCVEGNFEVTNEEGDICAVEMLPNTDGEKGKIKGEIKDVYGDVKLEIGGNWTKEIWIYNPETKEKTTIWTIIPSSNWENYFLQPISFSFNQLTDELKKVLPKTDSRFRPDQRLMEKQELDAAADEKHRLEEKQREARKRHKKSGFIPKPLYFDETYDDVTGELIYEYKGNYWEARKNHSYVEVDDIF